jgi:putative proteasome-type protease
VTFCIGIRVEDGLVVLSDTRVVKGAEVSRKAKLSVIEYGGSEVVVMTSGLRSVRDKVVHRVEDRLADRDVAHRRMHDVATTYGDALREVRREDAEALSRSGFSFDSHAIIAGQLVDDADPVLMHVYPEGNWVASTDDAPYLVIGRSSYGKPILDRLLRFESDLEHAISLAYLAFDATRASATDVDFPIDIAVLRRGQHRFVAKRFSSSELDDVHDAWHARLHDALADLPTTWAASLVAHRPKDTLT